MMIGKCDRQITNKNNNKKPVLVSVSVLHMSDYWSVLSNAV